MGFLKKLFQWRKKQEEDEYEEEDQWENVSMRRDNVDIHDKYQREKYVKTCLQQLAEASKELETLGYEYNLVTAYLTDIEEIEAMPPEVREKLADNAKNIVALEDERTDSEKKINKVTDVQFQQMQRLEELMPEGLNELKKTEEYQAKIKQDLNRLDGEKHAYHFQLNELKNFSNDIRGMVMICLVSLGICAIVLAFLQFSLKLDVRLGYLIVVAMAAAAMTFVFVKHNDSQREIVKLQRAINKIILLQNTVKIRYVNNTNLLDYLYMKYNVKHSNELKNLWERYLVEKEERQKYQKVQSDLDFHSGTVIRILRKYHIQDPNIWLHQAVALYDNKEMVEIRHGLIIRRQKLRKQMEYNGDIAQSAQDEVKDLVQTFPEYAKKILQIVSDYEKSSVG